MTLVELLVTLLVFGVVVTAALRFLDAQSLAFHSGVDRMTAIQNVRFALGSLEENIQTAGTNVPPEQPSIVYAGEDVFAFSADYATNVGNDIFAVFHDPDASDEEVSAPQAPFTIPNTSFTWPDTVYQAAGGGGLSPAELIVYYFAEDDSSERDDDYVLLRQVNDGEPEVVARNLLEPEDRPFFQYLQLHTPDVGAPGIQPVPDGSLPLVHDVAIHGSAADTGSSALADSVRAVRVNLRSSNGRLGEDERVASLSRTIRMPNLGRVRIRACGDRPIFGSDVTATLRADDNDWVVDVEWDAAIDEGGGNRDVIRYVIWRRVEPASDWGATFASVPAGLETYLYDDGTVEKGVAYRYAVAAQDCTPNLSQAAVSDIVVIPEDDPDDWDGILPDLPDLPLDPDLPVDPPGIPGVGPGGGGAPGQGGGT